MNRITHKAAFWGFCSKEIRSRILCAVVISWFIPLSPSALAQRPFRAYETFYRDESARREFFDRYALTGEVSYRPAGSIVSEGLASSSADPFGFSFRFDYELAPRFDLGVIVDAASGFAGRSLSVSWISLKYYRTIDNTDYAFRLAVDPSSDARTGFPQTDLAFIYSAVLSAELASDFAIGMRRIRIGYEQLIPTDPTNPNPVINPGITDFSVIYTRALGWELNATMSYKAVFDPAGSNVYFAVLGQAGAYNLVEALPVGTDSNGELDPDGADETGVLRGGVIWLRSGMEFSRPSYEFTPFLGLPIQQWAPENRNWPAARLRLGIQLMLR